MKLHPIYLQGTWRHLWRYGLINFAIRRLNVALLRPCLVHVSWNEPIRNGFLGNLRIGRRGFAVYAD